MRSWRNLNDPANLSSVRSNDAASLLRNIGRRIAEVRASRRLTQEAFAERLDVTARYVQRVESGGQNISVQVLATFASGLGVPAAKFFEKPKAQAVKQVRPKRKSRKP